MRDRLDRPQKLGLLDLTDGLRGRMARKRLAHEYPEAPAVRCAQLLAAIEAAAGLLAAYRAWVIKPTT